MGGESVSQGNIKQDALERVILVASDMLLNEPCEMKVVKIAELARCSTATIYEAYVRSALISLGVPSPSAYVQ